MVAIPILGALGLENLEFEASCIVRFSLITNKNGMGQRL